ncbi:MAG: undecaprenyl/decaprenyl-phosphate alpha-N-acetylglucosaminyl 1-phosphate transferase [Chloroflexi bacterium]|nr:undecaprenyl/decaprenyl-phosphate alpha-N-acetylglucosaminyl 1-phosphate transferase [Chloroflexota bacterium]
MMLTYLFFAIIFLIGLASSFMLVPLARRFGFRYGFVDHPRPGEVQSTPVARTGGYAIFAAFLAATMVSLVLFDRFPAEYPRIVGLLLGGVLVLPIAFVDDLKRLGPLPQLVGQIVIAAIPIAFGILLDNVANPFGGIILLPYYLALPLTLFWFVGMINTLNFLDTMDGLAGGITGIAAVIIFLRAVDLGQNSIAVLALALAAACFGFLPYNLHPARVFMGTSGSMFLGYALAILGIIGGAKVATILMVLSIPILDTALVIARRTFSGRSPFKGGDAAHLPHRMLAIGLPQSTIAFLLYALCLILGYFALALSPVHKLYAFGGMALALAGAIVLIARRTRTTEYTEGTES